MDADMAQLSTRLAMARLRHQVSELQSQVEQDRKLQPPIRKVYYCVVDDTALTAGIADFKKWIADGAVVVTVPLAALDGLDQCKKGTDPVNVNSRECIRYFDRIQNGSLAVRGINFQTPQEAFDSWKECEQFLIPGAVLPSQQKSPVLAPITPPGSPGKKMSDDGIRFSPPRSAGLRNGMRNHANGAVITVVNGKETKRAQTFPQHQQSISRRHTEPASSASNPTPVEAPRRIQQLLNCVLYRKHRLGKRDSPPTHMQLAKQHQRPDIHLITNSAEVAAWAKCYDINVMSGNQLEDMVEREDFIYNEKLKEFQENQLEAKQHNGHSGGGRGGRGRAGRGGGGMGGRNGHHYHHHGGAGNSNGRNNNGRGVPEPEFVFVREAPRGVARGKGKLWEP